MKKLLNFLPLPGMYHRFSVSGLNLERLINSLAKENIPLRHVSRPDGRTMICECRSSDLPAIRTLAQDKGWRVANTQPLGVSAALLRFRKRPGIPCGILLACILMLILSQHVWQVEINGAGPYRAEISAYLDEQGFVPGIRRSQVDADALTRALTYRYPELAWFHVYVSGARMVVDVTPGVPMPELSEGFSGDIVASHGGIVTSIQVYAGTALVKPGDVVRKGQILIRGTERSADEQLTAVQAQGVVKARCWESFTVKLPLYEIRSEETGRETTEMRIHTPFFTWPKELMQAPYLAGNLYIEALPLAGCFFPVQIQRVTAREVSMEYVLRNADEVRAEAAQAALKHLKAKHFSDEIIDKWVDYCMIEDGSLAAKATVEWLMDIGSPVLP